SGNVLPEAGEQFTVGLGSTLSVAVTLNETGAPNGPVASTPLMLLALIVGAVVSVTLTVNDWTSWLPELSVAVHVTVLVPSGNRLPGGGEQLTEGFGSTLSVAVGSV